MNRFERRASAVEDRQLRYFDLLGILFVATYIISQVASSKLFVLGPFVFPGAIIIFPISYIFGDALTEVYGYARSRRIIWAGFISAIYMSAVLLAVQHLPSAPFWRHQAAYDVILGFVPRVVVGSILAFWAGEFSNSYVLAKMKLLTGGRYLWTRTIGSTIVGEGVDSVVFAAVAFGGTMSNKQLVWLAASIYGFKVLYEVFATPLTYVVVNFLKRREGVDVFDSETRFSPFRLSVK